MVVWKVIFSYKKELHTIPKKEENNSTIETNVDKHDNKVSMYETVKEVDEEIFIKGKHYGVDKGSN